ncbi:hypothetical protein TraAM80_02439 [Trypanosoma rangeli]|uniref:Uncharacterized protein n=1 Tax=Trypanosoma rangeli TaxID=5698 RepID=A0A3R7KSM7_TRYRA|nr:uncharacterized protein TraAM80_02439 [Trypanosoma rangeli]RNF08894.1 hypothetical protein TraAM80_02439 [Trypanosoma rangeli]|eukprot:RNF08894.1 hypothetical protein TraAM80_02439 [Trypanosoma rangeli]
MNSLGDNRALLHVLSLSENTSRSPDDILASAIAGGVVRVFADEKKRYIDAVLLPSSLDLTTLATFITDGFFTPFLRSALGDHLPRYTILTESGCFELLSLPVLLFPDCFSSPPSPEVILSRNSSSEGISMVSASALQAEVVDVVQLHQHRSQVGLLLLKSVNDVLRDAEVWKLRVSREKTPTGNSELPAINAVMALFYEAKMLLLCCIVSTQKAYAVGVKPCAKGHNFAQNYFSELFTLDELRGIFDHRGRPSAEDVEKWYDARMHALIGEAFMKEGELQEYVNGLQQSLAEDERRITGAPISLMHRPHDAASTTLIHLPCVHCELPRLTLQPGEMTLLLFDSAGVSLLFDAEPSKLCLLLRRCASVKLTASQLRSADVQLASFPWSQLCDAVVKSVEYHLSNDKFLSLLLEKNSSILLILVQWLTKVPTVVDDATVVGLNEARRHEALGASMADHIIEHVIFSSSFGAASAQFIRGAVGCAALSEALFYAWVDRSLTELENKPPALIGLFALVVVFFLAQRGWDLPEATREPAIRLCAQHKQQPDCLTLLNHLRRHSQ